MGLHNKVEKFLSEAEILLFTSVDKEVIISLNFPKEKANIFKDVKNHNRVSKYFEDRIITLAIVEQAAYYRASLIDTQTGDSVNIDNVKFVTQNLEQFINAAPLDIKMIFVLYGLSSDGSTRIMQPIPENKKPIIIHGYSYSYNQ